MDKGGQKTLLVISDDQAFYREILEMFQSNAQTSRITVLPCSRCSHEDSQRQKASFVLIDLADGELTRIEFAKSFALANTDSKIICAGKNLNVDHVLYLLKNGVHHFLKVPLDFTESQTLFRTLLSENQAQKNTVPRKGKVVTVYSPKGGSGVTLLSINLAIALKSLNPNDQIAVCDLAPQAGDVSTYLNLAAKYSMRELIDNVERLDQSLLEGVMGVHESGVHVLAAPNLDQEALSVNCVREWQAILEVMKQSYDLILIDSAHTDEVLLQHTLVLSDSVLLVGNLDVPSLKGLLLGLNKLARLQIEPEKIKTVINRFNAKNQLDIKEFTRNSKIPISSKLPNDYSVCIESINTGKPFTLGRVNSEIGKKIKELAEQVRTALFKSEKKEEVENSAPAPAVEAPKKLWGLL